ncbi:regulator of G protein signaling-like protein, partial [Euroglyphus maynei]
MKFDSYVRFLKSDIYEKCSILDLKGESLPYENDDAIVGDTICDTLLDSESCSANTMSTSERSGGYHSGKNNPAAVKKRRSFIPWARLKSSINHKAASLSSMAAPSSTKAEMFGSKKQYMMRKLTNSIHKIRSKSLDEHLTNHVNNKPQHSIGSETQSHNSSIDKSSIISIGQKNQLNSTSRSSLMPHSSDSIDSSDHNVFPSSPDNMKSVEIIDASCSPPTSTIQPSTIKHLKSHSESDPASPAKSLPLAPTSTSTVNLPSLPSSASSSSFNHNCNRDNCHFLRIVFPDRSQTVVPSSPNETINNLLKKLFEKRSLKYLAWDVFITGVEKPLDLSTNTTQLGCVELRVEQRVIFRIEFPSQDIIGVKTRPTKLCSEIFHPLLIRYGYRPEHTVMTIAETEQIVPQMSPVSVIDGQHIIVSYFDDLEEWGWDTTRNNIPVALSLTGKSYSEDSSIKSKIKDEKSMGGQTSIDQQQQASSVPSIATYHNLGSIRDHLLASRYIAAKNNQSNNSNLECSPQLDSYDSPTNTSSSPGDDTQSDIFFRELMKTAHTVPSPPRGPSSTSTYSAAYGIINNSSIPDEASSNRSKQSQTQSSISNTNRMP